MIYYIYYLTRKNADVPFYVGATCDPYKRLLAHNSGFGYKSPIDMILIDYTSSRYSDISFWEFYYMQLFRSWGFILKNKSLGYVTRYNQKSHLYKLTNSSVPPQIQLGRLVPRLEQSAINKKEKIRIKKLKQESERIRRINLRDSAL